MAVTSTNRAAAARGRAAARRRSAHMDRIAQATNRRDKLAAVCAYLRAVMVGATQERVDTVEAEVRGIADREAARDD